MTERAFEIDSTYARERLGALTAAGFVANEVAQRQDERLDVIRIAPEVVVDAHSVPSTGQTLLARRFPHAERVAVRVAPPARGLLRRLFARPSDPKRLLVAPLGELPLPPQSADLIWSLLALHWHPTPHELIPKWYQVLRPGGLLLFSAFGPDTLKEVATAFRSVDAAAHVLPFIDMHDYGDMLVEAGFETPVMDMEVMRLTYASSGDLWADVRALGGNPLRDRRRGLIGRGAARRLEDALAATRDAEGRYQLTFEIISGHAWKGEPRRTAEGHAILRRIDRPSERG